MGSARTAPNPVFESAIKKATEQPEGMGRTTSMMDAFTSGSNIMGRTGRATMSGVGASGGTGIQDAISGIVRPTASATIKAPEPSEREDSDEVQDTEQNFENIRNNLLAKAKERRSKISEMKEEAISKMSMPSPTDGLDKFSIDNYRAGGAAFDRDDTKSVGDDMTTGKPKITDRIKTFLGDSMTDPGGFQNRVRGV